MVFLVWEKLLPKYGTLVGKIQGREINQGR